MVVTEILLGSLLQDITEAYDAVEAAMREIEKHDEAPAASVHALRAAYQELFQARVALGEIL